MAQQLKDEVRDRIMSAALDAFASRGFRAATMAGIARRAGISTGNIYRYSPDKETLFDTVVPPSFAREFLQLIRRRVRSLEGVTDVARLPAGSVFRAVAEELLAFSIANRLRVIVLLGRAEGTRYAAFAPRLRAELQGLALAHYRGLGGRVRVTAAHRFALERIYDDWLRTMVEILAASRDGAEIRERVEAYSRYHLGGLNALFA
ncbi:MAG TPA: helix-turn-helix domain-containing protein [Vicinamibacterales bacterium]|nr:helix-turn-helix domain-containing protein [Vicinamibacterales bacterium]